MQKEGVTTMAIIEATQPNQKSWKTSSYVYHICGLNGHKMTDVQSLLKCKRCFMGNLWQ
jgi:hypothetical protein